MQQDDITLIERKRLHQKSEEKRLSQPASDYRGADLLQNEKNHGKRRVQLRTIAMEFWANLEHQLRYKKTCHPS
ncbi:MAG: hypothetical protein ACLU3U_02615 [Gallintestinimicrobium sp.]